MKRIFLTSALFLSLLSYGQAITELIEKETAQELKYEAEDSKGACDSFKLSEKKEKAECLEYWAERVRYIKKNREDALKDLSTYYQNKEILLSRIKEAHDHILINPKDSEMYDSRVRASYRTYINHINKCLERYNWGKELHMITIHPDPKTVYKVVIRKMYFSDFNNQSLSKY